MELFRGDPRFDHLIYWNPEDYPEEERWQRMQARFKLVEADCDRNGWDFLNLFGSFEGVAIGIDDAEIKTLTKADRQEKYGGDLYGHVFKAAQIACPERWIHDNTIHFSDEQKSMVKRWREKNADMFVIMVAMAGSGICKVFPTWLKEFCHDIIASLPNAKIFLAGGPDCTNEVWECTRTVSLVPGTTENRSLTITFKDMLLMAGHCNFVFGPDTGLLMGAGMMGVPKSTLCTIVDRRQFGSRHRNDFSLQSTANCSPCHVLAYTGRFCEKEETYGVFPICTDSFDLRQLKRTIVRFYEEWERQSS